MSTEQNKEERIYSEAISKPPQERQAYIEKACGNDKALLERVKALLKSREEAGSFLDGALFDADVTLEQSPLVEVPGTIIGRYKLLEQIGEGGFGIVYMAEQTEPIHRKVALKIIKLGMDTKQVIARFEAERQALAMMDHPNIARVLDAGATETGRPYFVMELVKGIPITEYCDKNNLNTQQRLEMFIDVCRAVQHAHQKGIIHRDIKPSNVMITLHDGKPVPKVIDFGIAKATSQRLTEKTVFTRYAQMIGTPEYMSPEQAEMSGLEIDTRTDIYSLGVLLYELLTGATPFDAQKLREASYIEMQRIIRETEPLKPSTKLSTMAETLADIAKHRQASPDSLSKLIRGDLDWIVMKTLEKDRTRRYERAIDLAADLERHLNNESVQAVPPKVSYRLHKFIRRNRVAVAMIAIVSCATLMGATVAKLAIWNSGSLPGKVEHASGMGQRHVWDLPSNSDLTGGISGDGRYISYVDWTAGNLAVYDQTNKINSFITNNTDPNWENSNGSNESSIVSSDGKKIAYSWLNHTNPEFYDLRIINMDGTDMRVLYHDPNEVFYIMPHDFSPDGKEVLTYFSSLEKSLVDEKNNTRFREGHLVLISVTDGSVQILKTWQKLGMPKRARFSPDGRYVVYDFEQEDEQTAYDVFLLNLDNGNETALIEHPADDKLCGWTPEGRRVVFISDRSSKRDLWMIEVAGGLAQGQPQKLLSQFEGWPIGFTDEGSLYYGVGTSACNVYLAQLDSTGLNFDDEPELASSQFVGSTMMADWSVDGSFLAYKISSDLYFGDNLAIRSVETSEEHLVCPKDLFHPGSRMHGPWWSPDGQSLLVFGESQEGGRGLHTVNVETGKHAMVAIFPDGRQRQAVWSPDGKLIYTRSPGRLNQLDPQASRENELYPTHGGVENGLDVSPDGRLLAFYQSQYSLVVMPSEGGEPREVVKLKEDEDDTFWRSFVKWMPDGEHLLFSRRESQLWKVNIKTGVEQQIGPEIKGLSGADINPDGRQIAFTVNQKGSALWVIENFLPD